MNPASKKEAEKLFKEVKKNIVGSKANIIVCAPFVYLETLKKIGMGRIGLGSQNVSHLESGAVTGGVSASMLASLGVKYCIVGHSECRALSDTDQQINLKIKNLLKNKITPILCVGERERDEAHTYLQFVANQIKYAFLDIPKSAIKNIIIAYEPVWAIGASATRTATSEEALEMNIFIKKVVSDITDEKIVKEIPILYGGSADESDAGNFMTLGGAFGLLLGRASLDAKKFGKILKIASDIK